MAVAICKMYNSNAPLQQHQHQRVPLQQCRPPLPRLPHTRPARAFGRLNDMQADTAHSRLEEPISTLGDLALRRFFLPLRKICLATRASLHSTPRRNDSEQHQAVPSPPSRKSKTNDDSLDEEHSSKRDKQADPFLVPPFTVTVENQLLEDSVDDVGGDFYFSSHYDDCVDSTDDDEDSLKYSESSEDDDEELFGLDLLPDTDDDDELLRQENKDEPV